METNDIKKEIETLKSKIHGAPTNEQWKRLLDLEEQLRKLGQLEYATYNED